MFINSGMEGTDVKAHPKPNTANPPTTIHNLLGKKIGDGPSIKKDKPKESEPIINQFLLKYY